MVGYGISVAGPLVLLYVGVDVVGEGVGGKVGDGEGWIVVVRISPAAGVDVGLRLLRNGAELG